MVSNEKLILERLHSDKLMPHPSSYPQKKNCARKIAVRSNTNEDEIEVAHSSKVGEFWRFNGSTYLMVIFKVKRITHATCFFYSNLVFGLFMMNYLEERRRKFKIK